MRKTLFALLVLLAAGRAAPAGAFWEWTPQTGRWLHSRFSVRETAAEQLAWAEEAVERGEPGTAVRRLRQLVGAFPDSPLVPRARLRIGELYELAGNDRRAYQAYRELLDRNPASEEARAALEKQFELASRLTAPPPERRFSFLPGLDLVRVDPGEEIAAAIEQAPYAPRAEQALYDLGMHYFRRRRYQSSIETFDRLAREYSRGEHLAAARYQAALAAWELSRAQPNNRDALEATWQRLGDYLALHPDGADREAAAALRARAWEQLAARELETARFYARTGRPEAARLYYQRVVDSFPDTAAAREAAGHLR